MANLTNFMEPRLMKDAEIATRSSVEFKEWEELCRICISFLSQGIFVGGDYESLSQPEKDIVRREECIVGDLWYKNGFLPAEMANSALGRVRGGKLYPCQREMSPLVAYSALPKTKLGNIRNAAEKLSFAIVPYEYINQDGIVAKYAREGQREYSQEVRNGFEGVNELAAVVSTWEKIELYILCPISFYDPWQEVQDTYIRQKLFGGELSMVATILGMMMPTQKNLYQMSKTNAKNIETLNDTMRANFADVLQTLDNMQSQISWLRDEVFLARSEAAHATTVASMAQGMAKAARRTANEALELAKTVDFKLACLLDPLVFAVPQGTDLLHDDVDARLMMCFGVDMPLDFFLRRGLVQVDDYGCYKPILRILH